MGFKYSVSLLPAIQATGPLALTLTRLTLAEHASLSWTHDHICIFRWLGDKRGVWQVINYLTLLTKGAGIVVSFSQVDIIERMLAWSS